MASLAAGEIVTLSPWVRRITANNPGVMTGAGTNCYLIGQHELAVLDPGPANPEHLSAIMAAVGTTPVRWIVVTHTHPDHSPAAAWLAEKTGATLVGAVLKNDSHQDASFSVERDVCHGDLIKGDGFVLEAIATPGHVANHFCYLLRETGDVFTGDHINNGSTVLIIPPGGDMADYLHSLALLKQYPIKRLLPGHGDVMDEPWVAIDGLIAHRQMREQKVWEALCATAQPTSIEVLTPLVYSDVDASLHTIAQVSLWAHLLKLEREGKAAKDAMSPQQAFNRQMWRLVG
jgi:glyoxylase-like metal-dependent hydrolase (beta-lactamase superfamily II)